MVSITGDSLDRVTPEQADNIMDFGYQISVLVFPTMIQAGLRLDPERQEELKKPLTWNDFALKLNEHLRPSLNL